MKTKNQAAGRPRDAQLDEAILSAALDLFIEEGFDRLTFEKVAQRTGTTRPAIYRRWKHKTEMVSAAIGQLRDQTERELDAWQDMRLEDIVEWLLDAAPRALVAERMMKLQARFIGAAPDHPEFIRTYRRIYLSPRKRAFQRILEDAKQRGVLPADADIDMLQDIYSGTMIGRLFADEVSDEHQTRAWLERLLRHLGWLK